MTIPILPALLSAIFLAGSTGSVVTAAASDGPGKAKSERAGKPDGKRAKALGLCAQIECTAEQKVEIEALREHAKAERKAAHEEMKRLREEARAKMLDVLSDEQRAELAARAGERKSERAEVAKRKGKAKGERKNVAKGKGKGKGKAERKGSAARK